MDGWFWFLKAQKVENRKTLFLLIIGKKKKEMEKEKEKKSCWKSWKGRKKNEEKCELKRKWWLDNI